METNKTAPAPVDRMQHDRRELKFFLTESIAQEIRLIVAAHLALDVYGVGRPNYSYLVNSIYWESDDWTIWWENNQGVKNRYKLRMRWYDDKPDSPVFFEIKQRMNMTIMKQRATTDCDGAFVMCGRTLPGHRNILANPGKGKIVLARFIELAEAKRLRPRIRVSYLREAYVPFDQEDNRFRISFDRRVIGALEENPRFSQGIVNPIEIWGPWVVMELKFAGGRFPDWFKTQIIEPYGLVWGPAPKCSDCTSAVRGRKYWPKRMLGWRKQRGIFVPEEKTVTAITSD